MSSRWMVFLGGEGLGFMEAGSNKVALEAECSLEKKGIVG